jgi:exopolysaccharide production protein ExoZ
MAATDDDRLSYVDGLRAVAVLGVVMSHAAKYTLDFNTDRWFHPMYEGAHGVDLFFVISGFCLSYPTLARSTIAGAASLSLSRFFAKRALRIYPPYWFAWIAVWVSTAAMIRLGYQAPWPTIKMPGAVDASRQLFLVENGNELVGSFWTLAVELRWYLAFPLLLWLWAKSKPTFIAIGIASLVAFHFVGRQYLDLATLPAFMLGIVAADWTVHRRRIAAWAPVAAVLALVAAVRFEPGHLAYAEQDQIGWQLVAFFVVVAGCNAAWLKRALSLRPLVLIGTASYSIYLFHDFVMGWYGKYGGSNPLAAMIAGVLAGLLAWVAFERPYMDSAWRRRATAFIHHKLDAVARRVRVPTAVDIRRAP